MNDIEIPQTRTCASRPAATFTVSTLFFQCLVCLSRVNCYKQTLEFLVHPGPHLRTAASMHEMVLAEIQLEIEPVSIVVSSTLVASRGVTRQSSIAGEITGNARTVITQVAKLTSDRSVELTADAPFLELLLCLPFDNFQHELQR